MILPGVGSFGQAMEQLKNSNWTKVLKEIPDSGKPFLKDLSWLTAFVRSKEESEGGKVLAPKGEILRIPDKRIEDPISDGTLSTCREMEDCLQD